MSYSTGMVGKASADSLFAEFVGDFEIAWVLGWWMCKTVPYVQGVSVCASVYSLVAVSLDRCSAIWFPLGGGFTRRKARVIIFLIWVVSCTLALPWALYFDLETPDSTHPQNQFCLEKWPAGMDGDLYFLIGNMLLCYVLPLIVISFCYLLIWLRVIYRNVPTDSVATLQKIHHKAKIGVLKMLVVVVLVFLLSWLPLYSIFARIKLGSALSAWEDHFFSTAIPIAQWLGSSNSALNPIIYAALNVKFRRAFLYLLPKCCNPHPPCHPNMTKSSLMQRNQTSLYNVTGV
ncbi:Neuropeptide FF receptor 2 [Folsomia candida]|uniref:Neuropeptide FF receptor 2 n=1 Tax=Folsomia candida TaxID=158441 RepID=A0A226E7G6_FOLCA|nr:Neuropeptide FF receptor 2 [Folsomia candida]